MSEINTDVEQMQAFLDHLRRFDHLLDDEFRSKTGHWRNLGGVWTSVGAAVYARQPDGGWQSVAEGIDLHALAAEIAAETGVAVEPLADSAASLPLPWSERGAALPAERREGAPGGAERRG